MIRVAFVGAVNSGKSSALGQLMLRTDNISTDRIHEAQLAANLARVGSKDSRARPDLTLAWLVDGLRAERSMGATIDVAYRYLRILGERIVVQDCPGHVELAHGIVTGLSTAEVVVAIIDATTKVTPLTLWHLKLARMFRPRLIILAINKIDAVNESEVDATIGGLRLVLTGLTADRIDTDMIKISAKTGDGILELAQRIVDISPPSRCPLRIVVQNVLYGDNDDMICGTETPPLALAPGRSIKVSDCPERSWIAGNVGGGGGAVRVHLPKGSGVRRGSILFDANDVPPTQTTVLECSMCWLRPRRAQPGEQVVVRIGAQYSRAVINQGTFHYGEVSQLVQITTSQPVWIDDYAISRGTGAMLILDPDTQKIIGVATLQLYAEEPKRY